MEKGENRVSNDVTAPSGGIEEQCLELLDGALYKCFVENKYDECFGDTNFKDVYQQLIADLKEESSSETDGARKVDRVLNFLKVINGALLVIDASSMNCVVARCFQSHIFHKKDLIGNSMKQFVHEDNQHYFDVLDQPSVTEDSVDSGNPIAFECRFCVDSDRVGAKQDNCEFVSMKCIKFVERFNMENLVNKDAGDPSYVLYLATPASIAPPSVNKGPPNQTVNSRDKIPQPEKFCTRQDLNGELTAVGLNYDDLRTSKYKIPPHMKDVIERCLCSFMKPNVNGKSLKDVLLQQVLNQGKGISRTHRIQLANGTFANWLTKSELLPRTSLQREVQQIFSVHYIYKQGTLNGLNVQGLPESLHNIIPVPPEAQAATSSDASVTMTTTSIATTTSFSPDHFLPSTPYPNQPVKSESFMNESRSKFQQWQSSRTARTSLETTKDFLSGMPGPEPKFEVNNFSTNINGGLSPPPLHFDGPMVHAVGGHNQMLTSSATTFHKSLAQQSSTTTFARPSDGTVGTFLSPNPDTSMLNPGTFVGPPCVDLGDLPSKAENLIPVSTTSVTSVFVDSITTMRMEASVTTTQCRVPTVNTAAVSSSGAAIMRNTPFSPSTRACVTPDQTPTSCQHSPPKRPRSASINTAPGISGSLKRTASTLSEDSGIGDSANNCKISPIQRSKSKDKSKTRLKNTKLLNELLTSKNTDEVSVSYSSNNSKNPLLAPTTSSNLSSSAGSSSLSFNNVSPSISLSTQNPCSKIPVQTSSQPVTSQPTNQTSLRERHSLSSSQSNLLTEFPDEREIPDDIFSCYESIISSSSEQHTSQLPQQSAVRTNHFMGNLQTTTRAAMNNMPPTRQDSTLINPGPHPPINPNPPDMMISSLTPQPQTILPQPLPSPHVVPATQSLPTPPPFPSTTPPINNPTFRRIVPTGQETCPNRVIGSRAMLSPKTQSVPPVSQYRDFGAPDNWAGQEPLVDLGAYPPPAGINPRMAIPSHSQLSQPMLGNSTAVKLSPNPANCQAPANRMSFQSSGMGMSAGTMQVNPSAQLQTPNNGGVGPSVSPRNFTNTGSPTGYPQMQATLGNNITGPLYSNNNNTQHQRIAANGSIRSRLLRQQPGPNPLPFRGAMPPRGSPQHYNLKQPELSRYLQPQRANGALVRPRKTSPGMQRAISSPGAPNMYNQIAPSPRFPPSQGTVNPYSPVPQQSHFSNSSSTFNNDPSMNFDPGLRSPGGMAPQNPNQYPLTTGGSYNNTMNNMGPGPIMGNSYPGEQINAGLPTSPMGKPQLKRSRSKKITRKKTGSTDDGAWNDDLTNNAYKQRPLMQMTIGNMHQRPQPTYHTSLDGALQPSATMMSPQGGNRQTINLNTLMNQNKNKMMDKVSIDPNVPPASFQTPPNPASLQPVPAAPNNWPGNFKPDDGMTSSLMDDGMLVGIFDNALPQQSNPYPPLDGIAAANSNVTMNSNLNNNKFSDVNTQLRYTATATMLPDAPSGFQKVDEKIEKQIKRQKNTKLLESLLLQKDE